MAEGNSRKYPRRGWQPRAERHRKEKEEERRGRYLVRWLQNKRGRDNEKRLLAAFEFCKGEEYDVPAWLIRPPCRATKSQDKFEGIDIVAELDIGEVYINVKSSQAGVAQFDEHQKRLGRYKPVFAIAVYPDWSAEETRQRTYDLLARARERIIAEREVIHR